MALTKDQKKAQVADVSQKMKDAASVMFAHYIGLSVGEVGELREKLREGEAEMKVAKKTLMKIASKEAGMPEIVDEVIEGPVACIFSYADPLTGAQIAFKFGKSHPQVELIGGVFEGKIISKEEAIELAKMPSRDVLLAMFVGMLRSPLNSFAGICSSPLSGFARALDQMAEKGGAQEETSSSAEIQEAKKDETPKEETVEAPTEKEAEEEASSESSEPPKPES